MYLANIVPPLNIIINFEPSSHHDNYANSIAFLRSLVTIVIHYNTFVILVHIALVGGMDAFTVILDILLLVLMELMP
jgi:hypothetical protein